MQPRYDAQKIESKWYKYWLKKNYFLAHNTSSQRPFTMIMPPPNLTGALHLGHILQHTISDIIIRFKRMQGFDALWVPGVDHAGIQMQTTVEKRLKREEGKRREELGRKKFLAYLGKCKEEWYKIQKKQMRRIGESADWSREKFTLDSGPQKAVREAFFQFFKRGKIYYGAYLVNWCPHCQTALMDIETEYIPHPGKLYYLKYFFPHSKKYLVVATSRPETIFADVALAIHPQDRRYQEFIGKQVLLPLTNKKITVIADPAVDQKFGSGVLKITPGHSFNDYQIGKRHNLKIIQLINREARLQITQLFPQLKAYHNLKVEEARRQIIQDLKKKNLIEEIEDYTQNLQVCERCKTNIEPLVSEEWFVKMQEISNPAIKAIKKEEVKFLPARIKKITLAWLEDIHDWCISRNLWWGHPIPIFYCLRCKKRWSKIYKKLQQEKLWARKELAGVLCSKKPLKKCPLCGSKLKAEERVLDTWFSSGLWPFSSLGWPLKTPDLQRYYPSDLMVTAQEILYLWISRMIILGLYFMHQIPFRTVFVHGTLRDEKGQKMSKSLGNGVDPLEMIEKYSADALRFTLARLTKAGRDIKMSKEAMEAEIQASRNFMTKIWNVARFILSNTKEFHPSKELNTPLPSILNIADHWILAKLKKTIRITTLSLKNYQIGPAARRIYNFIWKELADWYLEAVKKDIYGEDKKRQETIAFILHYILSYTLKLLHPFAPFISEEIWQKIKDKKEKDLIISQWPQDIPIKINTEKIQKFQRVQKIVEKQRAGTKLNTLDKEALQDKEIKEGVASFNI